MVGLVLGAVEILLSLIEIIRINLGFEDKLSQLIAGNMEEQFTTTRNAVPLPLPLMGKEELHLGG